MTTVQEGLYLFCLIGIGMVLQVCLYMRNIYVTHFQVSNIEIEGGPQHTHKPPP